LVQLLTVLRHAARSVTLSGSAVLGDRGRIADGPGGRSLSHAHTLSHAQPEWIRYGAV
jgi:hypothetical protein